MEHKKQSTSYFSLKKRVGDNMNENKLINQGISYEYLRILEEHARQYDYVSDKKNFLRSISPYEQKIVLLNTNDPYEVLEYLDELDMKATREILNNLTYDEIKKVLSLFSSEDKKRFYTHYSDLSLVNDFIMYDKNASDYIEDLSFDRKVDLIDSSTTETVEATSKIYETMSDDQREVVSGFVTNSSSISALSVAETQVENSNISEANDNNNDTEIDFETQKMNNEQLEIVEQNIEQEMNLENNLLDVNKVELENNNQLIEKNEDQLENLEENKNNNELEILEQFEIAKETCEKNFINQIEQNIINNINEEHLESTVETQKII